MFTLSSEVKLNLLRISRLKTPSIDAYKGRDINKMIQFEWILSASCWKYVLKTYKNIEYKDNSESVHIHDY